MQEGALKRLNDIVENAKELVNAMNQIGNRAVPAMAFVTVKYYLSRVEDELHIIFCRNGMV